jgi:hypothetical protein
MFLAFKEVSSRLVRHKGLALSHRPVSLLQQAKGGTKHNGLWEKERAMCLITFSFVRFPCQAASLWPEVSELSACRT